jgi:predicted  nucleic acid-binding Zn-ribbon protein
MIGVSAIARLFGGKLGKFLLIGGAVVAIGGYIAWQQWTIESLEADKTQLQRDKASLEANLQATEAALADEREKVRKLAKARDRAAQRAAEFRQLQREVDNAPDSDDGPVAPVLRSTLERLRERSAGRADQEGATGDTGGAADSPAAP